MSTTRCARRLALATAIAVALSPAVQAATFTVTNANDSGAGSLRAALEGADAVPGADEVVFDPVVFAAGTSHEIVLQTPLSIDDAVTVTGPGADVLALDGDSSHRVLEIQASVLGTPVTLGGLTFRDGFSSGGNGGCIAARSVQLLLQDSVLTGCEAGEDRGGALALFGGVPERDGGKGVVATASLVVRDSVLSGNQARGAGAIAAEVDDGNITLERVTLEDNRSDDFAGAAELISADGDIALIDSVISGNTTSGPGGGLILYGAGDAQIRGTQFVDNRVVNAYGTYAYGGGAMVLQGGDVLITGSSFTGNAVLNAGPPPPGTPTEPDGRGGGLFVLPASVGRTLRIDSTQFTGNSAELGGGALVGEPTFAVRPGAQARPYMKAVRAKALAGTNEIVETRFAQNTAYDGSALSLFVLNFPQNKAVSPGMTLDRVTLIDNSAVEAGDGAAALLAVGDVWPVQLINSTVTHNDGGIVHDAPFGVPSDTAVLILDHTTVTDNDVGGVAVGAPPSRSQRWRTDAGNKDYPLPSVRIALRNSVVHGSGDGADLDASPGFVTMLHSLVGTTEPEDFTGYDDQGGNQFGVDPLLGEPGLAGHPFLEVRLPLEGSPLIDAGDPDVTDFDPPSIDQRGALRIVGAAIDIGATEAQAMPGTVSFDPAALTVAENAGTATFTAVRSGGDDGEISVQYATQDGTATAGADFTDSNGQLAWADGESGAKTFTVAIANDTLVEPDESFTATLSEPTGDAVLGTATATATIVIDDAAPVGTLGLAVTSITVDETAGTATLSVMRSGGSSGAATVDYATANGTALAGSDYTAGSGTLSWADGDTAAKNIVLTIIDDALIESPENFTVALSNATGGATLGTAGATVTITSNDAPAGTLAVGQTALTVNETAGTATLSVTRSGGSFGAVSVNYASAGGSATAGSDFTAVTGTLSWADGDTAAKNINVPIIDDAAVEANEQFTVTLSQPGGGAALGANTSTVTIVSNDQPATGMLQFDGLGTGGMVTWRFNEDGTPANATKALVQIAVTRSGGSDGPASIDYATQDGTATAPADYTATSGTLSWAAGESGPRFISVMLIEDGIAEGDENFRVVLSNAQGAGLGVNAQAQIVIAANGGAGNVGADPITIPAGDARGWLTLFGAMLLAGWMGLRRRLS